MARASSLQVGCRGLSDRQVDHARRVSAGALGAVLFGISVFFSAFPITAQQSSVSGTVVSELSQPIEGVRVIVIGSPVNVSTDADGQFRITNLAPGEVRLRAARIGYAPMTQIVRVGGSDIRFVLSAAAITLDDIVVTGTAGDQQRRAIGHSVATISVEDLVATSRIPDAAGLINGRAPGVVVRPGTGQPGSGPLIRVRGASSFSLGTQPLIYVDGIRVDNSIASGPNVQGTGGLLSESGGTISRLNDFHPEDIERIEVIRGPAAATLYGTEASNGVIQIITKKGRPGETQFGVTVRQGTSWFMDAEDRVPKNWGIHPDTGELFELNLFETERALGNDIFKNGSVQGYGVNLQGGDERATYYFSANLDRENGVEPTNELWRFTTRANVRVYPRDDFDAEVSVGYVTGRTDLSLEAGRGGMTFGLLVADPSGINGPNRGFGVAPPEVWHSRSGGGRSFQDLGRTTLGLQLRHRPAPWLSHRLGVGLDVVNEDNQFIQERPRPGEPALAPEGTKSLTRRDVSTATVDYSASVHAVISPSLVATTTVGAQYFRRFTEFVSVDGTGFPVTGVGVTAAAGATTGSDAFVENNTLGLFVQEQIGLNDRVFLTGAVRADDNSAFGKEFDLVYYPKISGTWVINEERFWGVPWVDALKLRGAFGAAGQQPEDFAALRSYRPVTSGTGEATLTPQFVGNDSLAPERGREWELGFEAGLFGSRLGVDFTYYNARTTDAILLRSLAPSLGFPGTQFVNAGEITNAGVELQLRALAVQSDKVSIEATLNLATNRTEIKDLGGVDQGAGLIPAHPFIPVVFHVAGFAPTSIFEKHVVSADLDPNGVAVNVLCDSGDPNGKTLPDGTPLEWGGSAVPCDQAPRLFLGRTTPSLEGSFSLEATLLRRLHFLAMVDWKTGHRVTDGARLSRCGSGLCEEIFFPERFDPITIAGVQSNLALTEWIATGGKFAKLREVSVSYDFPDGWASTIGAERLSMTVAGRNLHTWTDFGGIDPEGFFYDANGPAFHSQNNIPQLAQVVWTVSVAF